MSNSITPHYTFVASDPAIENSPTTKVLWGSRLHRCVLICAANPTCAMLIRFVLCDHLRIVCVELACFSSQGEILGVKKRLVRDRYCGGEI
jgi:hypothetical protein